MTELRRSKWGPGCWAFLHAAAAVAVDPPAVTELIALLPRVLPCEECRKHSQAYLEANPPGETIVDAASASRFVFDFHNEVNQRIGKPLASSRLVEARYNVQIGQARSNSQQASFDYVRRYRRL